jgi:tetratricopeptide (TPR) repeat protein
VALLAAAVAGGWIATRPSPSKLLELGLVAGQKDSAAGERLLRRAMASSPGRYPDAEIALCLLLANRGEWESASSQFESVDAQSCRDDLLLAFGRAALQAGRGAQAQKALEAVRRRGTRESAASLELLIANYSEWGQKDELLIAAHELAQLEPHNPRPWVLLIQSLKSEPRREMECLEIIREALKQNLPERLRLEVRHWLIEQLIVCGDAAAARRQIAQLPHSEDDSFRLRVYEVDLCRLEGRPDKALQIMNEVFSRARDPAEACLNRGIIYLDLFRYDDAVRDLERTVAMRPMHAAAHFKLSEAYRGLRREELARRHLDMALGINEKRARVELLRKQLTREAQNRALYEQLAELYRELGDREASRQWEQRGAALIAHPPGL